MVFKKFTNVSRNKDISYNLLTDPITISPAVTNALEINGTRTDDTVFTLFNEGNATATYTSTSFGSFNDPQGLAIDPATQFVYVSDGDNDTISVFNSSGVSQFTFGGNGTEDGQFLFLGRIRIINRRLFAIDDGSSSIKVFDMKGNFIQEFGQTIFDTPEDIAIDSRGKYYVLDSELKKVFIFDQSLLLKISFGLTGTAFTSIAINSHDTLYIIDQSSNNIQILTTTGVLLNTVGSFGIGDLQFSAPNNISIKNNDDIFISDQNNARIQVLNKDGAFLYEITGLFTFPGASGLDEVNNTVLLLSSATNNVIVLTISTTEDESLSYRVYGSSNTSTDFSDSNNKQWVNLLSIRDIEEGNSTVYDHDFSILIPVDSRTYESFSNSWKSVLVTAFTTTNNSTLSAFSRGKGH